MAVSFRALTRSDLPLLEKWLPEPHVAAWWNDPSDLPSLEAHYGPAIDGQKPVHIYLIQSDTLPIGWIQWYRWRDYSKHANQLGAGLGSAGIDLAIGELDAIGCGLGPTAIREFAANYILVHSDVRAIVADPAAANLRSVRAFQKAGFNIVHTVQLPGETFERHVVQIDDVRFNHVRLGS